MTLDEHIAKANERWNLACEDRGEAMRGAVEAARRLVASFESHVADVEQMDNLLEDTSIAVLTARRETVRRDNARSWLRELESLRDAEGKS